MDDGGDLHRAGVQAGVHHGGHDALQELQEAISTGDEGCCIYCDVQDCL